MNAAVKTLTGRPLFELLLALDGIETPLLPVERPMAHIPKHGGRDGSSRTGLEGYDLYLSRRVGDTWSRAVPLEQVSSSAADFNPSVSPDGLLALLSSTRALAPPAALRPSIDPAKLEGIGNGQGDIYRIELRRLGLPPYSQSPDVRTMEHNT
ncbi:MAG: hypothetical protein AB7Q69_06395 [Gemmatimonadales bacterium]